MSNEVPVQEPPEAELSKIRAVVKTPEDIRTDLLATETAAQEILAVVDKTPAGNFVAIPGDKNVPEDPKAKAYTSLRAVQTVLFAAKDAGKIADVLLDPSNQDPTLKNEASDFTKSFVKGLVQKIQHPEKISLETAPYIHKLLSKLFKGEVRNSEQLIKAYKEINSGLEKRSPELGRNMKDAVAELVQTKKGLTSKDKALELMGEVTAQVDPLKSMTDREKHNIPNKKEEYAKASATARDFFTRIEDAYQKINAFEGVLRAERIKNFLLNNGDDGLFSEKGEAPLDTDMVRQLLRDDAGLTPTETEDFFKAIATVRNLGSDTSLGREDMYPGVLANLNTFNTLSVREKLITSDGKWNMRGAEEFERKVLRTTSELFKNLDPATPFNEQFSDFSEGQLLRTIKGKMRELGNERDNVIRQLREDLIAQNVPETEMVNRLNHIRGNYDMLFRTLVNKINIEFSWQRLGHEGSNVFKTGGPEQWKSVISRMKPFTEMAIQLEDDVLAYAVPFLLARYQEDLVENKNNLLKDVNVSQYTDDGDPDKVKSLSNARKDRAKDELGEMLQTLIDRGIITRDIEEWEIERARAFAEVIFTLNLSKAGIFANGNAIDDYSDYPDMSVVSILNPKDHRWDTERGNVGVSGDPEVWALEIQKNEELARKIAGSIWSQRNTINPEDVAALGLAEFVENIGTANEEERGALHQRFLDYVVKGSQKEAWSMNERIDNFLAESSKRLWGHQMRNVAMGSWIDRNGWRTNDGLRKYYAEEISKYPADKKPSFTEWVAQRVGVGGRFFLTSGQAGSETGAYLLQMVEGLDTKAQAGTSYTKKNLEDAYSTGENRLQKVMKVKIDGNEGNITYNEYKTRRERALRGHVFYEAVQKDPIGFLNTLSQTMPQIIDTEIEFAANDGTTKKVPAWEYYFLPQKYPDSMMSVDDINKRTKFRKDLSRLFGIQNWQHIRKLMHFNYALTQTTFKDSDGNEITGENNVGRDRLFRAMNLARETAHTRERKYHEDPQNHQNEDPEKIGIIRADDVVTQEEIDNLRARAQASNLTPEQRSKLQKKVYEAENRMKIRKLMFDESDALIPYLTNIVGKTKQDEEEYFGNGTDNLGKDADFYQRCAAAYFEEKSGKHILPNFYRDLSVITARAENDNIPINSMGDLGAVKEAQDLVFGLPGKLQEVAMSKDINKLFEYQSEVYEKLKVIDEGWAQDVTRDMCEVITQWFEEIDGDKMFPINIIQKFRKGEKISISKMKYGPRAYSWSGDEMNAYFRKLKEAGLLRPDQYEHLLKARKVELSRLFIHQIGPNVLLGLILYLLYIYTKEALEENGMKIDE